MENQKGVQSLMFNLLKRPATLVGALCLTGLLASAQSYWGAAQPSMAMPGTVNYVDGQANIDGRALPVGNQAMNTKISTGETLATGANGKAEVLLMPGVVMRIGGN